MDSRHLAAVAQRYGLDDPTRHMLWSSRLHDDEHDIASLRDAAGVVDFDAMDHPSAQRPAAVGTADVSTPIPSHGGDSISARVQSALTCSRELAHLNAFTTIFAESALRDAEGLDRDVNTMPRHGALRGWLVGVKDMIDIAGHAYSAGTLAFAPTTASEDAPVVAALRRAGAVIFGATNLHALAYGALGTSSDFGPVGNPLRADALAGGSSGGSAAAVAVGLVDLALGTDTGGSIRIPASLCGVVGLKPTYGLVPTAGVLPLGPSLDHVGPIARTVAETAAGFAALVGMPCSVESAADRLDGLEVGVPQGYFCDHLDDEVRAALNDCVSALKQLGAVVRPVDVPAARLSPGAMLCTLGPEAFSTHLPLLRTRAHRLPEDVRLRLESAMFRAGADYVLAQRVRRVMREQVDRVLGEVHVLLTPTVAVLAPCLEASSVEVEGAIWSVQHALTRLTMPFNLTGHPALTLPWAKDSMGGSIGVQLVSGRFAEDRILDVAAVLERQRRAS